MIVTLTANTTFDQTLLVPTFDKNRTIRATRTAQSMGGKPTDASFILGELGTPSLALGFAAGVMGRRVEAMLHARGVKTDFIEVGGETRINTIIVSQEGWQTAITTQTLEVTDAHVEALNQRFKEALDNATVVVTGGTLPPAMKPSWYADVITLTRERSVPVIFDADEPNLSAGLQGRPNFAKPNRDELSALLGYEVTTKESAYRAGREMLDRYGTAPIITLGSEGALAVLPDRAYFIPPIPVEVVSASGAGDGVLAGLASAISQAQPIEEGLRLGFASATAVLLQLGTADCRKADVERFLTQIELIPYVA